jgi:SH3-like domain-containing protein
MKQKPIIILREVEMKIPSSPKSLKFLVVGVLIAFVGVILAETLVVKVQRTYLRQEPVFYASTVAVLKAGVSVEKLSVKDGWYKVRTQNGVVGWLHSSSVKAKKFSLLALDKSVQSGATADEVALAGKGFNKQVEEKYKTQNTDVSFFWVDKMLKIKVTPQQLKSFLQKGKLGEFGGSK